MTKHPKPKPETQKALEAFLGNTPPWSPKILMAIAGTDCWQRTAIHKRAMTQCEVFLRLASEIKAPDQDSCWEWQGKAKHPNGYGIFNGKTGPGGEREIHYVHRLIWSLTVGPIQDGLWVLHHCDNPACCNPRHLFLGTHSDNMKDAWKKGRLSRPHRSSDTPPESKKTERRPTTDAAGPQNPKTKKGTTGLKYIPGAKINPTRLARFPRLSLGAPQNSRPRLVFQSLGSGRNRLAALSSRLWLVGRRVLRPSQHL